MARTQRLLTLMDALRRHRRPVTIRIVLISRTVTGYRLWVGRLPTETSTPALGHAILT